MSSATDRLTPLPGIVRSLTTPRRAAIGAFASTCLLLLCGLTAADLAVADAPCPPSARCGSVTVPLDRADRSAGTVHVGYVLLPRREQNRPSLGTIVPNPGGPGNATTAFAPYLRAFAPLRARRDLLLIDPRGTGRSDPIACPSLATIDPLRVTKVAIGDACGRDLGARAGRYGSAAVADDIDAVRAGLGIRKLDLWGDSYGTFLMTVYAARHPHHVRSIVLDGAFPVASDPWGRDVLRGVRRVIGLVCRRTHRCSGTRVLADVERLGRRLQRHPLHFSEPSPLGRVRLRLGEDELADVTYAGGKPATYGLLPAAVSAALHHDPALLERLVFADRAGLAESLQADPAQLSIAVAAATACHDYPRPYELAALPAQRHGQYRQALAALDRSRFRPFSPRAWLSTGIDAGPGCLNWPADPTAGSPLRHRRLPDVPVLVQSGDLDSNTPVEQGRAAAAQFPHATFAVIANVGHTPDTQACGLRMAHDFIRRLEVDATRCHRADHPPTVIPRPVRRADQLSQVPAHGDPRIRRAVAVALATIADARMATESVDFGGTLNALRGGTYVVGDHSVRFVHARIVSDAVADGVQTRTPGLTRTRLRLHGPGVPRARLALRTTRTMTHITGNVGRRRVDLRRGSPDTAS